ncbi:MAG: DUF3419 family protein [Parachlamydiaceae bacterium]|nr:DUF3419 family protein [Parachlamydiaceae bacterium]
MFSRKEKRPLFFSQLNYSFGNEDWTTEHLALRIKPGDRVLTISAGGDRALHPLLDNCASVTAVDANEQQNFLLDLKMAAIKNLDFPSYLSFLGINAADRCRLKNLEQISHGMHPEAAQHWKKNKKMISSGIIYQGALEKTTRKTSSLIKLFRRRKIRKLFAFLNIDQQSQFIDQEWNGFAWRKFIDIILHPTIMRLITKDPQLYTSSVPLGRYIYQRMTNCLKRHLARECAFISLVANGKVEPEAYPPYLTEKGFDIIKSRLDRITYTHSDIVSYLEHAPEQSFDVYSLSDVASYLSIKDFDRLLRGIVRTAKPGARFSIRQVTSNHKIPDDLHPLFVRDPILEERLEHEDRCFVYRFMAGNLAC